MDAQVMNLSMDAVRPQLVGAVVHHRPPEVSGTTGFRPEDLRQPLMDQPAAVQDMKKTGEIVEVEPAVRPLGQKGGYAIGHIAAVDFANADVLKRWVQAMRKEIG